MGCGDVSARCDCGEVWRFNSRTWPDAEPKKKAGRSSVLSPFKSPPFARASVLARADSLMGLSLSAAESLENNELAIEVSDPWLERRSMANGEFVRALERQDKKLHSQQLTISSSSRSRNMSALPVRDVGEKLTGCNSEE
jgi:hypothetical protein